MDAGILKQVAKQTVRMAIGEPYIGQGLKLRRINAELPKSRPGTAAGAALDLRRDTPERNTSYA